MTIAHKAADIFAAYQKQIMIAAGLIAAVILILAGASLYSSSQERSAAPLVAAAMEAYAPSGVEKADFARALGMFKEAQKKYPGTTNGAIAQYYIGNCLVNLGQIDDGVKEYWSFTTRYANEKLLLGLVYQRMAYAYIMQNKYQDAAKAFEQAEATNGPGVGTIELARLLEASGNMPEAQKRYKVVAERLGGTSWAVEAMGKVQFVAPPQAPVPAAAQAGK